MDRIDLHVQVPPVPVGRLESDHDGETSEVIRGRVERARDVQTRRFTDVAGVFANAQMGPSDLRRYCRPPAEVLELLQKAVSHTGLSARGYHRILKVARTIADLDGSGGVGVAQVAEALQYRALDRPT